MSAEESKLNRVATNLKQMIVDRTSVDEIRGVVEKSSGKMNPLNIYIDDIYGSKWLWLEATPFLNAIDDADDVNYVWELVELGADPSKPDHNVSQVWLRSSKEPHSSWHVCEKLHE